MLFDELKRPVAITRSVAAGSTAPLLVPPQNGCILSYALANHLFRAIVGLIVNYSCNMSVTKPWLSLENLMLHTCYNDDLT